MLSLVLSRPLTSALAALALLFAVLWGVESFRAAHLKERVETAEAEAQAQAKQAETNQAGAAINDRRARNTHTAYQQSEEARRAIQTPDYDAALREYGAGIDRVREAGRAGLSKPDGRGSGEG